MFFQKRPTIGLIWLRQQVWAVPKDTAHGYEGHPNDNGCAQIAEEFLRKYSELM